MNPFQGTLISYFSSEQLKKIRSVKIGIAGAGGLGSNCAFNLVRSGFENFVIADFDVVEYSNLNRQFYFYHQVGRPKVEALKENLAAINPDVNIRAVNEKIEHHNVGSIFRDCDIIVEAFDSTSSKTMLVEEYMDSGKLLVAASGIAGWGGSDEIRTHKIRDAFYLVGDLVREAGADYPPVSPRVNIAAAKQADIILEYVLKV